MPENPKYLSSPMQRFVKITAGFIGGYIITELFYMVLMLWFDIKNIVMTLRFGGFMLWVTLMTLVFLAKNGWKIWGIYISTISSLLYALIFLLKA